MDLRSLLDEISSEEIIPRRVDTLENILASIVSGEIRLQSLSPDVLQLLVTDLLLLSSNTSAAESSLILSIFGRLLTPPLYPALSSLLPPSHVQEAIHNAVPLQVQLACDFLKFVASQDPSSLHIYLSPSLLSSLPTLFSHQDLLLVENITDTLVALSSNHASLSILFSDSSPLPPGLSSQLREHTSAIRVLTAVSRISALSLPAFEACRASGLLSTLPDQMSSEDPLSFLCYLDTLRAFCLSSRGYAFYRDCGLLSRLLQLATAQSTGPAEEMVRYDIIVFFFSLISLPHTAPEARLYYHPLFSHLFSLLEASEDRDTKVFLESLAHLSSLQEGRELLNSSGSKLQEALCVCGSQLVGGSSRRREQLMSMFSALLREYSWMSDRDFYCEQTHSWFRCIGTDAMKRLFVVMKQPFSEQQLGAFSVCRSIAAWKWGQEEMLRCPGLLEFLLNSENISGEDLVYTRFDIISILANSRTSQETLGSSFYAKIREQLSLGAYHVKAQYVVEVGND